MAKKSRANNKKEGILAHKDCEVCGKHFDEYGNELVDITIAKLPIKPLSSGAVIGISVSATVITIIGLEVAAYFIFKFINKKRHK